MLKNLAVFIALFACSLTAWAEPKASKKEIAQAECGTVSRDELDSVIVAGPQTFISGIEVEAAKEGKRFLGFRFLSFFPESPLAKSKVLLPGDIILSVNGQRLERPEHYMQIWEHLKEREIIELKMIRGSETLTHCWRVVP